MDYTEYQQKHIEILKKDPDDKIKILSARNGSGKTAIILKYIYDIFQSETRKKFVPQIYVEYDMINHWINEWKLFFPDEKEINFVQTNTTKTIIEIKNNLVTDKTIFIEDITFKISPLKFKITHFFFDVADLKLYKNFLFDSLSFNNINIDEKNKKWVKISKIYDKFLKKVSDKVVFEDKVVFKDNINMKIRCNITFLAYLNIIPLEIITYFYKICSNDNINVTEYYFYLANTQNTNFKNCKNVLRELDSIRYKFSLYHLVRTNNVNNPRISNIDEFDNHPMITFLLFEFIKLFKKLYKNIFPENFKSMFDRDNNITKTESFQNNKLRRLNFFTFLPDEGYSSPEIANIFKDYTDKCENYNEIENYLDNNQDKLYNIIVYNCYVKFFTREYCKLINHCRRIPKDFNLFDHKYIFITLYKYKYHYYNNVYINLFSLANETVENWSTYHKDLELAIQDKVDAKKFYEDFRLYWKIEIVPEPDKVVVVMIHNDDKYIPEFETAEESFAYILNDIINLNVINKKFYSNLNDREFKNLFETNLKRFFENYVMKCKCDCDESDVITNILRYIFIKTTTNLTKKIELFINKKNTISIDECVICCADLHNNRVFYNCCVNVVCENCHNKFKNKCPFCRCVLKTTFFRKKSTAEFDFEHLTAIHNFLINCDLKGKSIILIRLKPLYDITLLDFKGLSLLNKKTIFYDASLGMTYDNVLNYCKNYETDIILIMKDIPFGHNFQFVDNIVVITYDLDRAKGYSIDGYQDSLNLCVLDMVLKKPYIKEEIKFLKYNIFKIFHF